MGRRATRDYTVEEFEAWCKADDRVAEVAKAADETGGPRLSLVPVPEQEIAWPTDLLPPSGGAADGDAPAATPFDGVPLEDSRKRLAGWSAERQRVFLSHLAETGSVHLASSAARLSARAAYRLRVRSPGFAAAWDVAERLAVGRLSALAFDRAIHGRTEQVYQDGALVAEKRMPSDKLLMWLLARLDPRRYAARGSNARAKPPTRRLRPAPPSPASSTPSPIPSRLSEQAGGKWPWPVRPLMTFRRSRRSYAAPAPLDRHAAWGGARRLPA